MADEVCCTSITFLESQKRKPARASCDAEERAVLFGTISQLNFTSQPNLKDGECIELQAARWLKNIRNL
jgi:hypothetical protein